MISFSILMRSWYKIQWKPETAIEANRKSLSWNAEQISKTDRWLAQKPFKEPMQRQGRPWQLQKENLRR